MGCRLWGYTESDTTEATQQQQQQFSSTKADVRKDGLKKEVSFLFSVFPVMKLSNDIAHNLEWKK